jgi:hypothetical protein
MKIVIQVIHSQMDPAHKNRKRIGLYQSKIDAHLAIEELRSLPGFRNPGGTFSLHECLIDHDYIPYGFDASDTPISSADITTSTIQFDKLFFVYSEPIEPQPAEGDAVIFIGYYSSELLAKKAIRKLYELENFHKSNKKFEYSTVYLNQTSWTSGYATVEETMNEFR